MAVSVVTATSIQRLPLASTMIVALQQAGGGYTVQPYVQLRCSSLLLHWVLCGVAMTGPGRARVIVESEAGEGVEGDLYAFFQTNADGYVTCWPI
jgi:hypothetical protein